MLGNTLGRNKQNLYTDLRTPHKVTSHTGRLQFSRKNRFDLLHSNQIKKEAIFSPTADSFVFYRSHKELAGVDLQHLGLV